MRPIAVGALSTTSRRWEAKEILVHHLLTHTSGYVWYDEEPMLSHMARRAQEGFEIPPCEETQHPLPTASSSSVSTRRSSMTAHT